MGLQTATNPDTGERVVLVGDQWKPFTETATNDKGVKAYLTGDKWLTDEGPAAGSLASQIPTERGANLAPTPQAPEKQRGFFGTVGAPFQALSEGVISGGGNVMFGGQRLVGQGLQAVGATQAGQALITDAQRRQAESQARVAPFKQEYPMSTGTGELGAEIIGTLPVGGAIAAPLRAIPAAAPLAQAIRTGGFSKGNLATRAVGGATLGGASSAIINPDEAGTGAIIGGAVPFAGPALGYVGGKVANLRTMPQNRAANLAQQAAGADLKEVVNALRSAPPGVGVAQAIARFQNPALQALVKDSLESTPQGAQYLNKLSTMTENEAVNELGKLVGVQKAQISKLENSLTDARFETILKVFKALNAKINFNVELLNQDVKLA